MSADIPLEQAPTPATPNFHDPENCAYQVFVAAAICIPVVLTFTGIRVYVKKYILKSHGRDDCMKSSKLPRYAILMHLYLDAYLVGLVSCSELCEGMR